MAGSFLCRDALDAVLCWKRVSSPSETSTNITDRGAAVSSRVLRPARGTFREVDDLHDAPLSFQEFDSQRCSSQRVRWEFTRRN